MKFKQFLQESPFKSSDWVEQNEIFAYDKNQERIKSSLKWITDDNKKLSDDVIGIKMFAQKANQPFEWILDVDQKLQYFHILGATDSYGYEVEDFKQFPHKLESLFVIGNSTIKSFKGIESLDLNVVYIGDAVNVECGLLRILKNSKIRLKIWRNNGLEENHRLRKALGIVISYLEGSRDLLECQNKLIDEDLEEFAKL